MNGYDYTADAAFDTVIPDTESVFALFCAPRDVLRLMDVFQWAKDTAFECANLDETVRYTSYEGYDFVSLVYADVGKDTANQEEINLFFAKRYLVAVFPESPSERLCATIHKLNDALSTECRSEAPLESLYYTIFHYLAADFSNALEELEDEIEALSEAIGERFERVQSKQIGILRKQAYTYKKLLRAFSYIGGQILIDENKLLDANRLRYFRNMDTRLIKLHDFADHLFGLSNELLRLYDSKLSGQTNDTVNKLTVITLFFGPISVITGIYGMNFMDMPELDWQYGYPAAIGLMIVISVVIYIVLKKNKWL